MKLRYLALPLPNVDFYEYWMICKNNKIQLLGFKFTKCTFSVWIFWIIEKQNLKRLINDYWYMNFNFF